MRRWAVRTSDRTVELTKEKESIIKVKHFLAI